MASTTIRACKKDNVPTAGDSIEWQGMSYKVLRKDYVVKSGYLALELLREDGLCFWNDNWSSKAAREAPPWTDFDIIRETSYPFTVSPS